jgi:hypothetical protein
LGIGLQGTERELGPGEADNGTPRQNGEEKIKIYCDIKPGTRQPTQSKQMYDLPLRRNDSVSNGCC